MGLALGVWPGFVVYANDTKIEVKEVKADQHFVVEVKGKRYEVTDKEAVEVLPNVFLSAGAIMKQYTAQLHQPILPRLMIDAPKSVALLRKKLYEKRKSE